MERRWLIIADDLTGAADCGVAFAKRRMSSQVIWGDAGPDVHADAHALAFDADSRPLTVGAAARRHVEVLQRFQSTRRNIFKKIDSTLRGHLADEVAAMLDFLNTDDPGVAAVFAPAFPATGRITRDARVFVHGVPLEHTEFWPEDQAHERANLVTLLESAGLRVTSLPLATVRGPAAALAAALARAARRAGDSCVAVCDAETDEDLERIARISLESDERTLFIGSAGLAHAIARLSSRATAARATAPEHRASQHGALIVAGSPAQATRMALEALSTLPRMYRVSLNAASLLANIQAHEQLARELAGRLDHGIDVAIDLEPPPDARPDRVPQVVAALARLLAPIARHGSALAITGGETAAAFLARCGVNSIRLIDDIEPGISLGLTLGELSVPLVTKPGGFGDAGTLRRITERLRFIRQTGTVA